MLMSEVGFEPTPSFEDQNPQCVIHILTVDKLSLESGALDHSAILTFVTTAFSQPDSTQKLNLSPEKDAKRMPHRHFLSFVLT